MNSQQIHVLKTRARISKDLFTTYLREHKLTLPNDLSTLLNKAYKALEKIEQYNE